ncbi:hypothetical protein BKK79_12010 [Cupriavidus sp. USMAA2-4]|uniref:Uncharacterized protein n=1 Tax=Cupriavidus malaysiensis TaxID=367825 RepID=A0ABN4TBF7_9BURK|nr:MULTISPECIES: hypothetical protein [Cupriavidus]AOY92423.1 hypothetical protein BKK79_12010 [Cupriavidus sp. USMAA2-4]AOZ04422.1 hypothetical protein BKK80_00140 [Cupriavidus malaysiensis]
MAKRTPPWLKLPLAHWWQPGLFASLPAVALWTIARLPADLLAALGGSTLSALLNHAGDTLFVAGWLLSGLRLWTSRRRPAAEDGRRREVPPAAPSRHRAG